jgi:hypothetical protein
VPVCIATAMADVSSIEPCHLRATSARSVSSGAMDAVARMFKTIHLSRRGPMLRADACTPEASPRGMSASGQSRRFDDVRATSALPLIADLPRNDRRFRKVPNSDVGVSLDNLIGLREERRRNRHAERFCKREFQKLMPVMGKFQHHAQTPINLLFLMR